MDFKIIAVKHTRKSVNIGTRGKETTTSLGDETYVDTETWSFDTRAAAETAFERLNKLGWQHTVDNTGRHLIYTQICKLYN